MVKVDLITGFLGAGKTTFLLQYAGYLMRQNEKLGILVYDHGAMNVDLPLLNELRCDRCELETLAGSCDPDCHRRRFRTKLISMAMSGYQRVIIEPSGVFDMDEFFDTLQEAPLDRWYEIGNVIDILDAGLDENCTNEEDFFLASQAACAGCIVFSKVQFADPQTLDRTLKHLKRAGEMIRCERSDQKNIILKNWDSLTDEDYRTIASCGYYLPSYVKTIAGQPSDFQSLSFLDLPQDGAEIRNKAEVLLHNSEYGHVLRVKGFFGKDGRWFRINATEREISVTETEKTRCAITVIGVSLKENEINILLTGKRPKYRIL